MKKSEKRIIIGLVLMVILLIILLVYMISNNGMGSSSNMLSSMDIQDPSINKLYEENVDAMGLKNKKESSREQNIEGDLEGIIPEIAVVLDEIIKLYKEKNYDALYSKINHEYLKERSATLLQNMFESEQVKLFSKTGNENNIIIVEKAAKISNYYLCKFTVASVDDSNVLQSSLSNTSITFTIYLNQDGTYTYLPFDIQDLFIASDYGVSRITLGKE